ncbi:TRIC cation channel family protein, partial [Acinetobacter baumannii]
MNVPELALAGLNDHRLFTTLDLAGTFAFAISGAVAARDRSLDWFGVAVVAFTVAC